MAKGSKAKTSGTNKRSQKAASLAVASRGITTGHDYANFMSSLMADVISGTVSPQIANAACNAGGKLLKVVEMQMKYGTVTNGSKVLNLALSTPLIADTQSELTQ